MKKIAIFTLMILLFGCGTHQLDNEAELAKEIVAKEKAEKEKAEKEKAEKEKTEKEKAEKEKAEKEKAEKEKAEKEKAEKEKAEKEKAEKEKAEKEKAEKEKAEKEKAEKEKAEKEKAEKEKVEKEKAEKEKAEKEKAEKEKAEKEKKGEIDSSGNLIGIVRKSDFLRKPFKDWFERKYKAYNISNEDATKLKELLKDIKIEAFVGTWCPDSRRDVNRQKKTPKNLQQGKKIYRVPTFIFYKNGKEIGRFIENAKEETTKDIINILNGRG